jgi:hypothetical protein
MENATRETPERTGTVARTILAFLLAPGLASLGLGLLFGHPIFALHISAVAYPLALIFGVPIYLALRFRKRSPTLPWAALIGGLIVAIPVFLVLLSMDIPGEGRSIGFVTATNNERTLAGYVALLLGATFFGCFGALGGFFFWLIARRPGPSRAAGRSGDPRDLPKAAPPSVEGK